MRLHAIAAACAAAMAPVLPAAAHEILHEVRRDQAVAVRVFESDGDPVAGAAFEIFAPSRPGQPWATGRTDGAGWLAFVPGEPGKWRVRVIEEAGHGLDLTVEQPAAAAVAPGSPPPLGQPPGPSGVALALRPLLGLGVIGVVFAALFLAWRKKGPAPRP